MSCTVPRQNVIAELEGNVSSYAQARSSLMKSFVDKLAMVRLMFGVCLLVFGCLLALPGTVQVAFGIISVADDFKCKNQDCGKAVVLTWAKSSKTFTDGCDAAKCTGSCAYCGGSNTSHPYCFFSKGNQCTSAEQTWTYDPCGKKVAVACAKGGSGPSSCCPTKGGAATANTCFAPICILE